MSDDTTIACTTGFGAAVALVRSVHTESERSLEVEGPGWDGSDVRDYGALASIVEASLAANFVEASADHRRGFLLALADLLCAFGDDVSGGEGWDPVARVAAAHELRALRLAPRPAPAC